MSPDPCPRRAGDPASKPPVPSASGCGQHSPCQDERLVPHTRAALRAVGTDRGLQGGDPDRDLEVLWRLAASRRRGSSGKVKFGGRGPQLEHPDAARRGQTGACPGARSAEARLRAPGRRSPVACEASGLRPRPAVRMAERSKALRSGRSLPWRRGFESHS